MPWKEIGILVGLVICLLAIQKLGRRHGDESRSTRLMKKYKTLTPELLADTPDEELVEAVVACVLAEASASRRPDPAYTLSKWVQPYTIVYSIWSVCKELANGTYAALMRTATREMVEHACDGLPVVGAPKTAAALKALADAHKAGEDTAEAEKAFHVAVEEECPLTLCVTYIRDHVAQLTGTEAPATDVLPESNVEDTADGE